jgi:phosphate:Na+ symporter
MTQRLPLLAALLALGWAMVASETFQAVAAGVAIFLFGMMFLEQGFKAFAGGALERILGSATKTLPRSLGTGFLAASIMQSSSLVSVLTISFLSAGLLGLTEGIGVVFGANIGTTTGAWLMAAFGMKVKISAYSMPMLVFGLVLSMQSTKTARGLGRILAGVGFLFLGIHFMKEGFEDLQATVDLARWSMPGFTGLVVFTLVGAVATVIVQSSHASLMLIIAALATGQLTYEAALALTIGANVGTTISAVLGALGSNAAGRRLAAADVMFKVGTGVLVIAFIGPFKVGVELVAGWLSLAEDDWTLRLAVFHTVFNVVGVIVVVPLLGPLVRFLEARLAGPVDRGERPLFLNVAALRLPDTALEVLAQETQHLFDNAFEILAHGVGLRRGDILSHADLEAMLDFDPKLLEEDALNAYYQRIKTLYTDIVDFAAKAQVSMTPTQLEEVWGLRVACRSIARAVKAMTPIMPNIQHHARSPDLEVRHQYKRLRLHIARTLRRLYAIRATKDPATQLIAFQRLKGRAGAREAEGDADVDRLVRNGRIDSRTATSLMNDWDAAREVVQLLQEAAERVFVPRDSVLRSLHEEMLVGDEPAASFGDTMQLDRYLEDASLTGEFRRIKGGGDG